MDNLLFFFLKRETRWLILIGNNWCERQETSGNCFKRKCNKDMIWFRWIHVFVLQLCFLLHRLTVRFSRDFWHCTCFQKISELDLTMMLLQWCSPLLVTRMVYKLLLLFSSPKVTKKKTQIVQTSLAAWRCLSSLSVQLPSCSYFSSHQPPLAVCWHTVSLWGQSVTSAVCDPSIQVDDVTSLHRKFESTWHLSEHLSIPLGLFNLWPSPPVTAHSTLQ